MTIESQLTIYKLVKKGASQKTFKFLTWLQKVRSHPTPKKKKLLKKGAANNSNEFSLKQVAFKARVGPHVLMPNFLEAADFFKPTTLSAFTTSTCCTLIVCTGTVTNT